MFVLSFMFILIVWIFELWKFLLVLKSTYYQASTREKNQVHTTDKRSSDHSEPRQVWFWFHWLMMIVWCLILFRFCLTFETFYLMFNDTHNTIETLFICLFIFIMQKISNRLISDIFFIYFFHYKIVYNIMQHVFI